MPFRYILLQKRDGIAILTLNRPDRLNAFNRELIGELAAAVEEVAGDSQVKVLVITGAGKAFAAGADIDEMRSYTPLEARGWAEYVGSAFGRVADLPIPVIAAINGPAVGGGCELCLACDFRIASVAARLGQPEINLGIIPGAGGTQRLVRIVGLARAKELVLTGRLLTAREALDIGLVDKVVPPEQLMECALELARELAKKSPPAIKVAKMLLNSAWDMSLTNALDAEISNFALLFGSAEQREAMASFVARKGRG